MLVIEDGTGKADANSYATVGELVAFAAARGITLPATAPEQEALLIEAVDYMETLNYEGAKVSSTQALLWPRVGVVIEGWLYSSTDLPNQLKKGQLQLAVDAMTIDLLPSIPPASADTKGAVVEETVEGAVSVKYAAPKSNPATEYGGVGVTTEGAVLTRAAAILRPLLRGYGNLRVGRG